MAETAASYEVEIRCHFDSTEEAYAVLPFLHSCLEHDVTWTSRIYGRSIFDKGGLLRVGAVIESDVETRYLGWKGPDIGSFANIRQELDEEITSGISDSAIMKRLGADGSYESPEAVVSELQRLGHAEFMSFSGRDLSGYEKQSDLQVKLMMCRDVKWPVLVELEKTAESEEEAHQRESELRDVCSELYLLDRLVKEEPPTLLYERVFGGNS